MDALKIITYTGIFVFAVAGVLKARTKRFDIFGAVVLAFVIFCLKNYMVA